MSQKKNVCPLAGKEISDIDAYRLGLLVQVGAQKPEALELGEQPRQLRAILVKQPWQLQARSPSQFPSPGLVDT